MDKTRLLTPQMRAELIEFTCDLVRIKSFPGQEEEAIRFIERRMHALGYEEVVIDAMGNLVGRVGYGGDSILFDSHVDTVAVNDEAEWIYPPFGAEIESGRLYGRGAVDMKSGAAASIYAAALAHRAGLTAGKTVYVSCSVLEEECDGENLKHMLSQLDLHPDYAVICEPSANRVALGHKGKAQLSIKTRGVSAHSSAPEKGINPIYAMAEIIKRVEAKSAEFTHDQPPKRTLAISRVASTSASINAIPSECEIYLDRRMIPGESEADIHCELDELVAGHDAAWEIGTLQRVSWTGMQIEYQPFHLAWRIEPDHPLALASLTAYREWYGAEPGEFEFWDFSTNAVATVGRGIPTIGFGPGNKKLAHMIDEHCPLDQIVDACGFYTALIGNL
jgi:putative selenium metabolism hydrolase